MYGLEKKGSEKFLFDLEKEIKAHPHRAKEIAEKAEKRAGEIKKSLKEGTKSEDFDNLGLLLHGYTALQKVVKRVGA